MAKLDNIQRAEYLLSSVGNMLIKEVQALKQEQNADGILTPKQFAKLCTLSSHVLGYAKSAKELLSEQVAKRLSDEDLQEAVKMVSDLHEARDS